MTIHGEKQTNDEEETGEVLYHGIAARAFERSFDWTRRATCDHSSGVTDASSLIGFAKCH